MYTVFSEPPVDDIYEDNILGKLSDSRYATLDAQYEKEQSELTAEISVLDFGRY